MTEIQEVKEAMDAMMDAHHSLKTYFCDRMDMIQTAMNRTPEYDAGDFGNTAKDAETWARTIKARAGRDANAFDYGEYRGALGVFLRRGEHTLNPDEAKALAVGSDPDGGYWVTPEVGRMVTGKIFESSPVRQFADVQTIGSASLEIPIDDDEAAAVWVSETEARAETATPKIRKKEIVANEMSAEPRSTQTLLDDANINVEVWLANKVAARFAGPGGRTIVEDVPAAKILIGHKSPGWRTGPYGQQKEWLVLE